MATPLRKPIAIVAVSVAASFLLVACGDDSNDDSTQASTPATTADTGGSGGAATVALGDGGDLGEILVDADGRTLYLFEMDDEGDESYCNDDCASAWPPLTTKGDPAAGDGVDSSMLTTFKREDGTTQVAYNDHPLYMYSGDTGPGETNGQDSDAFGAEWYAMDSGGNAVEDSEDSGDDDSGESVPGY